MKASLPIVLFAVILNTASIAGAVLISPDTAIPSTEFTLNINGFDGLAIHTIDGSGLPIGFDQTATHDLYASGNHWTTGPGTLPNEQFITWGFGTPQTLNEVYLWNHQSTVPPSGSSGYDVTVFDLTVFDSNGNPLLVLNDLPLMPDTALSQAFSFGGAIENVSSVRFDVEAVQSSTEFTGLAEVAFNQVPEPSGLIFCVMCFLWSLDRYRMCLNHKRLRLGTRR